ncbi:MAG TPA: hypothetical protein VN426_01380 [Syntrophomonadaceae bacterium]|nr:hypothetical protein [Syntrophomonadaceae bacterium]
MLTYLKVFLPILLGQIAVNFTNVYLTSSNDFHSFLSLNFRFALIIVIGNFLTILGWFWGYQSHISLFLIFAITLGTAIATQTLGAMLFASQIPTIKQIGALALLVIAGLLAR